MCGSIALRDGGSSKNQGEGRGSIVIDILFLFYFNVGKFGGKGSATSTPSPQVSPALVLHYSTSINSQGIQPASHLCENQNRQSECFGQKPDMYSYHHTRYFGQRQYGFSVAYTKYMKKAIIQQTNYKLVPTKVRTEGKQTQNAYKNK